jgi:hypothetical protein
MDDTQKKLKELEDRISKLEGRRIIQADILPDVVKMRHIGEGVRYIRGGVTAGKPTSGEEPMQGNAVYFDETTNTLYIWNTVSNAWKLIPLTASVSTGWSVTNNTPDKSIDANGLVAEIGDGLTTLINTLIAQGILSA